MKKISLAISTFNNCEFVNDTLQNIKNNPYISEIILCDDCSKPEQFKILEKYKEQYNKIKIFKNHQNLGAYYNKLKSLSHCNNEWALMLDADNVINNTFIEILCKENWNKEIIYAPDWAKTFIKYDQKDNNHSSQLDYTFISNQIIDNKKAYELRNNSKFKCFLNTGNYFVNIETFLNLCDNKYDRNEIPSIDILYMNHCWLLNNKKIKVVKNLRYYHRLHNKSLYVSSKHHKDDKFTNEFFIKLKNII